MTRTETLAKFDMIARRRIALTTERSYRSWIIKYLSFLGTDKAKAAANSEAKMEVFLSSMAHDDYSSVSQNQAFNALLFLYRHVLKIEIGDVSACAAARSKRNAMFQHRRKSRRSSLT